MTTYKIHFEVTYHYMNADNYKASRTDDTGFIQGDSLEEITTIAVEFMRSNDYLTEKQADKRDLDEDYYTVSFSNVDIVTEFKPFSYDNILENHPEYLI